MQKLRVFLASGANAWSQGLKNQLAQHVTIKVVLEVETAPEAVALMQASQDEWDLAIVDVNLPQGGGIAVVHQCRGQGVVNPILIGNAGVNSEVLSQVRSSGVDALFSCAEDASKLVDCCARYQAMQMFAFSSS